VKRYGLAFKPAPTSAGDVYFPTDDLRAVLAQCDPLLTFTWQQLMTAATQGRNGPFTAAQLLDREMQGPGIQSPAAATEATTLSVQEQLEKLAALGLVTIEFLN
jgi:hypothetical protein